ncbi:hypothetical protein EHS25_008025 [Saitozyma podzolica]|uniref:Peptidase A1 domain-containing protein n=1 Tax=Saitozyma podzolica TaxID=1890683 RepID=A0A427YNF4_9TREE|nr:hypothetical protein EHS25_008025 [Saitozyma podzolica]
MMAFQRHHNSAIKRINKLTKRAVPPDSFFRERTLQRRRFLEEAGELEPRLWYPPSSDSSAGGDKRMWLPPTSLSSLVSDGEANAIELVHSNNKSPGTGGNGSNGGSGVNNAQGDTSASADDPVVTVTTTSTLGAGSSQATAVADTATIATQDGLAGNATSGVDTAVASGTGTASGTEATLKSKTGTGSGTGSTTGTSGTTSSGNTTGSTASITVTASGSNANGYSNAELQALEDNTVTNSSSDLITGGLDYEIEANDVGYLATVQLGTPAQDFLILMDSGSGDFWVPSSNCTAAECGNHLTLGTGSSSTFQASSQSFQVTYGSGAVAGTLCSDTVSIAGMTLDNHAFGVTTQESTQFSASTAPFDGLMGLSFSSLSQQGVSTPIESLASGGQVQQAIMGFALGRVADGENNGEIVFGSADTSKFDASTTQTLDVSSTNGFWQVPLSAITVNNADTSTGRQAILDTGTSLIVAPIADADAFHAQIQGAQSAGSGMYTIPCTTTATVTMTFGNAAFQIDPRDLLFEPTSNDLTGDCISAVSAGTVTDDQTWLLGDTFLKNVYFSTNVGASTVSLSARTDITGVSTSGSSGSSSSTSNTTTATTGTSGTNANVSNRAEMSTKSSSGTRSVDVVHSRVKGVRAVSMGVVAWLAGRSY